MRKSRWPSWAPVPNKPTVSVDVKQHSTFFLLVLVLLVLVLVFLLLLFVCRNRRWIRL